MSDTPTDPGPYIVRRIELIERAVADLHDTIAEQAAEIATLRETLRQARDLVYHRRSRR
jgi:hypothetical protein